MKTFAAAILAASLCSGLAAWRQVSETSRSIAQDQSFLEQGQVIFPIGHYIIGREPGPIYRDRLDAASGLWTRLRRPVWLMSGGQPWMPETPAAIGKRYLVQKGLPAERVTILDEFPQFKTSLDTTEEIGIASRIATSRDIKTLIVVADLMHLAQARLVFASYGIRTILVSSSEEAPYGLEYKFKRAGALLITLADRRGRTLFWLRWLRRHRFWPAENIIHPRG